MIFLSRFLEKKIVLINIREYANTPNLHMRISDKRVMSKLQFGTNFASLCYTQADILIYYVYSIFQNRIMG